MTPWVRCPLGPVIAGLLLATVGAQAQWASQSFTLKPGWNAIYTHVDASYANLDSLLDANGPVAEIWLWKPTFSTAQFITDPSAVGVASSQWAVWTSARGDTDTLTALVGNAAYLVRNQTSADTVWTVKGKPVPPIYQWTTTGLNFLGFPTPTNLAPNFTNYLALAPGLDLTKTLQNSAHVFRYPGGALGTGNPVEVVSINAATTPVTRGQAFWVRGSTNYYNRYYGPVEVTLQNPSGIQFGDTLGTYSLRLKNLTTTTNTVAFSLLASEAPPTGQAQIFATPPLLVRGDLSTTTLTYSSSALTNGQTFTLAPAGQVGSDLQVVLGLNRSVMTAFSAGSLYAGVLRLTDAGGLQQTDVPVTATVPDASGLWVGSASVSKVGESLKSYPRVDTAQTNQAAQVNSAAAAANRPTNGAEMPGSLWVPTGLNRTYSAVASSLDGRTLVAAVAGGTLYVSTDSGTNWITRDSARSWAELACSADGSVMAATVNLGVIYVSTNYGTNWTATATNYGNLAWVGLACSADGSTMAAVVQNGTPYTSSDRGTTWVARSGAGPSRNWSSIAMSANASNLVATVSSGQIYTSADAGATWRANTVFSPGATAAWTAAASSADGTNLVAAVKGGQIYTSADVGVTWTARATTNQWNSVASSTDGRRLAATVSGGQIYTSEDSGVTWTAHDQPRAWDDIISSADGTHLVAVVSGGYIYTLNRTFASYTVDPTTGLITDQNGLYLSSGVNTNLVYTAAAFPLRLILHNRAASNQITLLQHVYVGPGSTSTNTVIANRESLLDPMQLASARRISATHLPFTTNNAVWSAPGNFNPGSVVNFTVFLGYNEQASNPFLHTFHPDHDNLDSSFTKVRPRGFESYDVTRSLRLTFSTPGTDFASLTAAAQSRGGLYEETLTIGGQAGFSRDFHLQGTFTLQLISPVATLTLQ